MAIQDTTEFAATVVRVPENPVDATVTVVLVAGVPASCAPVHRSTNISCCPDVPDHAWVTTRVPGEPVTTAVEHPAHEYPETDTAFLDVNVCPGAVGVPPTTTCASEPDLTTRTSPLLTVIAEVTSDVRLAAVIWTGVDDARTGAMSDP